MSSKFFTNTEENTLYKKFEGIFNAMKPSTFKAVSAYFRSRQTPKHTALPQASDLR